VWLARFVVWEFGPVGCVAMGFGKEGAERFALREEPLFDGIIIDLLCGLGSVR